MTAAPPELRLLAPNPAATRALGERLGVAARAGDVIALSGPLGAGKTELARGIAHGLGVVGPVSSPSFVLIAEHEGRLPLFHIDGYRLATPEDALGAGLLDERRAEGVTVVEWAERLGPTLPAGRLEIRLDGSGDDPRTIACRATDTRHARLLGVLA
jgi:tRNA threonylcarbamoyladenosine biosynthesis protein TsaE